MPRSMVGLLAAAGATMFALTSSDRNTGHYGASG
jgi:hypothetical protein